MKSFKFLSNKIKWRTYRGHEIDVDKLTDQHLKNIINCFEGKGNMEIPNPYFGKTKEEWFGIFINEYTKRLFR
jgi:hypothetical protein